MATSGLGVVGGKDGERDAAADGGGRGGGASAAGVWYERAAERGDEAFEALVPDVERAQLRRDGRGEDGRVGAERAEERAERRHHARQLAALRVAQHAHHRVHELRGVLAQVETRAEPTHEADRTHARVRGRVVLLAEAEDRRHEEVDVVLEQLVAHLQRVQHLERRLPPRRAVLRDDREEGRDERREVRRKLVVQREAEPLDERDRVRL